LTAVETPATPPTTSAIVAGEGPLGSALTEAASELTELSSALVSFGKSPLALDTTALASSWTLVTAALSALVPFCTTSVVGSALTELFRLAIDEQ
jgi:hypothetical protein